MTTPDISVRAATEDDAARLAEIDVAAWRAAYRGVMTDEYLDGLDVGRAAAACRRNSTTRAISFYSNRRWLDDGGTLEDTRFDPPVAENPHSRIFPPLR